MGRYFVVPSVRLAEEVDDLEEILFGLIQMKYPETVNLYKQSSLTACGNADIQLQVECYISLFI
jgi:hypothetical protein